MVVYNLIYVINYCYLGIIWIGYDDIILIVVKVFYVKKNNLFGYFVWYVVVDNNWVFFK